MKDVGEIPAKWGARCFKRPSAALLRSLPLRDEDRNLLRSVGLPLGPPEALTLSFRGQECMVVHQPTSLRLLFPPDAVRPAEFPKTGDKLLDKWVDLSTFVVLGEVGPVYPSQSIPSPLPLVCLETGGRVVVYYHTAEWAGRVVEVFASDLPGYLRSWLVYKEWVRRADREIEALRRERRARLKALYNGLSEGLQSADPMGFADKKISLWPHRARNLAEDGLADSDEF